MTGAGLALLGVWIFLAVSWWSIEYRQTHTEVAGKEFKADGGNWFLGVLFVLACIGTVTLGAAATGALEKITNHAVSPPAAATE